MQYKWKLHYIEHKGDVQHMQASASAFSKQFSKN